MNNREEKLKKIVDKQTRKYLDHTVNTTDTTTTYVKLNDENLLITPKLLLASLKSEFYKKNLKFPKHAKWTFNEKEGYIKLELLRNGVKKTLESSPEENTSVPFEAEIVKETTSDFDDDLNEVKVAEESPVEDKGDDDNGDLRELFDTSIKRLRTMVPNNNIEVPHNMALYIKSLLIITKNRMFLSKSTSGPYLFTQRYYDYAMTIKNEYEIRLVKAYLLTVLCAIQLVNDSGDVDVDNMDATLHDAYDFIETYSSFAVSDYNDAPAMINKMITDIQIPENDHLGYREVLTDFILLKMIDDRDVFGTTHNNKEVEKFMAICHDYCFGSEGLVMEDVLEGYSNYVSNFVEGNIPTPNPVVREQLLAVFLIKYPDLLDKSSQLRIFGTFKYKYKTISRIVSRDFDSHVYKPHGLNIEFSEETLK